MTETMVDAKPTPNQIVAYNIARRRRELGMTQDEVGERLTQLTGKPWSPATMSAVERSWDGKRIRHFDADEMVVIADVLQMPVAELLAAPDEPLDVAVLELIDEDAPALTREEHASAALAALAMAIREEQRGLWQRATALASISQAHSALARMAPLHIAASY